MGNEVLDLSRAVNRSSEESTLSFNRPNPLDTLELVQGVRLSRGHFATPSSATAAELSAEDDDHEDSMTSASGSDPFSSSHLNAARNASLLSQLVETILRADRDRIRELNSMGSVMDVTSANVGREPMENDDGWIPEWIFNARSQGLMERYTELVGSTEDVFETTEWIDGRVFNPMQEETEENAD